MALDAVVVVPAHDEEEYLPQCLRGLARQTVPTERFETIVVLDACTDATAAVAAQTAAELSLPVRLLPGPGAGAGAARRAGMDAAAERLLAAGRPEGLIACTDADSRPAPDWLARQLAHVRLGARAIAGLVELDEDDAQRLPPGVLTRREREAERRLARVRRLDARADHHHFAGASFAVPADVYRAVGGLEPLAALEDAAFARRLGEHGVSILRAGDVRVRTSGRTGGRARRGLALDLSVSAWAERRRYTAADFPVDRLAGMKGTTTIAVVIPTKECAETIEGILARTVGPLARAGLVDELLVVDAGSADGTADIAEKAGARVRHEDTLLSEFGPALGKGDALWRATSDTRSDIVCFLDGDTRNPDPQHLQGLIGPLLADRQLQLVKGSFERPLTADGVDLPDEGGRVTELMARPLLNLHEPRLAGFAQPLAGEFAGHRELLEAIRFPVGYGVEIAVLIDALRLCGLDALAECHLGVRRNRHQPLRALGEMAYAVLAAVESRLEDRATPAIVGGHYLRPWEDGAVVDVPVGERPPLSTLVARPDRLGA